MERHNKPEVEAAYVVLLPQYIITRCSQNKELLLNPIVISRDSQEQCMIESSINSVRISLKFKKSDEVEKFFADRLMSFLTQRAESFVLFRRKPVKVSE